MKTRIYTPGAGHQPPVLAGRDELLRDWRLMLNETAARGRVGAEDTILLGPRGVGKTALLRAYSAEAEQNGSVVVNLQAVRSETGLIEALLHHARTESSADVGPWRRARTALEHLAGFNLSVGGFGAGIDIRDPSAPAARPDASSLAAALAKVADEAGQDTPGAGLLVTIDELQVAGHPDLALLAATLHRLNVEHPQANVTFAATGLPFTPSVLEAAGVTHPDRLFAVEDLPLTLSPADARYALVEPARGARVTWHADALERVIAVTNGYPAHLQLLADRVWRTAPGPNSLSLEDVEAAVPGLVEELGRRTFGPRWERMTDRHAEFLAALALLGGRAETAEVSAVLGRPVPQLSWIRDQLIKEGDIYAPRYGQVAMAVPLFTPFVLARYPLDREASADLLTLAEMEERARPQSQLTRELPAPSPHPKTLRPAQGHDRKPPQEKPPSGPRR